jgi:hypothetical protein
MYEGSVVIHIVGLYWPIDVQRTQVDPDLIRALWIRLVTMLAYRFTSIRPPSLCPRIDSSFTATHAHPANL